MPNYRRVLDPGGTYFFTVVTYHRRPFFTNQSAIKLLRDMIRKVMQRHPFTEIAYCILPDHLHTIWTLPNGDSNYSLRWNLIKGAFTHAYLPLIGNQEPMNISHLQRGEATIWQRRYWEHLIRDDTDLDNHLDYIHYNPVKHDLVKFIGEWAWSSYHRYLEDGYYDSGWFGGIPKEYNEKDFGE